MIARLFRRLSLVAVSLVVIETHAAHAACTISDAAPTGTLPTAMSDGERFVFWASADCATLEFSSGEFTKTPVRGPRPGPGPRTYHVNLQPSVWNSLVEGRDITFEWTVTGWTTAGVATEVTTTNELDFDDDGWTRSDGDAGTCDHDATRYPGATEICDGIDSDCDGDDGCVIGDLSLSDADAEYTGAAAGDGAAGSVAGGGPGTVAGAGDVNGDGYDDVVVGAFGNDDGGTDAGAAYLVLGGGSPASASLSAADAMYTGEVAGDIAGASVAGAGDVDGDGYDDVLVGAHWNDDGGSLTGAVYLVLGGPAPGSMSLSAADAEYTGSGPPENAGMWVSGTGDVNDDGYDDILVSSIGGAGPLWSGAAYLVLGSSSPASASLSAADAEYHGAWTSDFAWTSAGGGDVDGDGYDDMLMGAKYQDGGGADAGAAYLMLGSSSPASALLSAADAVYTGEAASDWAGGQLAGAGDVDGDGYADILVGACNNDDGGADAGAAYLVLGGSSPASASLSAADAQYTGEAASDLAGYPVAGAGDVDADGYDDVLVGAVRNDDASTDAGAAYLVRGGPSPASASLSDADIEYTGAASGDAAGYAIAGAGDVDDDGYPDVLVGAWLNDDGGTDAGAAYLLLGGGL